MAKSYGSITLKGVRAETARQTIAELGKNARVSPAQGHAVVDTSGEISLETFYGQQDQHPALAKALSERLDCVAFAVINLEDDLLLFWVFDRGEAVFQYDANPMYLGCPVCSYSAQTVPPELGDTDRLTALFGVPQNARALRSWLGRKRGLGFLRESDRHAHIARLLGLPEASVGARFAAA